MALGGELTKSYRNNTIFEMTMEFFFPKGGVKKGVIPVKKFSYAL